MLSGQYHFTPNDDIKEAYTYASSLRHEKARVKIKLIKEKDPYNLLVYHIENYIDFFEIFIREEEDQFKFLEKNKNLRLEQIKKGDKNDPFFRFCQAEIHLHWALVRLKFGQKFTATREVYSAYILLEENKKLFPQFANTYKSLSIIRVLAQSIPGVVRFLFGIESSIVKGTREAKFVYDHSKNEGSIFKDEIAIIYAYILYYQNNRKEEAQSILEKSFPGRTDNPLISFVTANMALKNGKNDLAIKILSERPKGKDYIEFHYLSFVLGKLKLYQLDKGSKVYLESFIKNFNGRHYIKEALQKMAWYHWVIEDDINGYQYYMNRIKNEGYDLIDEDKQALSEARSGIIPDKDLLKARLLFDGNFLNKAYQVLNDKQDKYTNGAHQLEYNYRMGRICHELHKENEAINYYAQTLQSSEKKSYYLCNSALQMALILEKNNKLSQALDYIKLCLSFSPDQYANSLHQKAKSAKLRIEETERQKFSK